MDARQVWQLADPIFGPVSGENQLLSHHSGDFSTAVENHDLLHFISYTVREAAAGVRFVMTSNLKRSCTSGAETSVADPASSKRAQKMHIISRTVPSMSPREQHECSQTHQCAEFFCNCACLFIRNLNGASVISGTIIGGQRFSWPLILGVTHHLVGLFNA